MSDFVWITHAPSDVTLAEGFMHSDLTVAGNQQLIELDQVARNGGVVDAARFPTEVWGETGDYREHHFPGQWPDISRYSGLWLISGKVAEILRRFDLGDGVIAPVRLFRRDHVTPVPGDWFFWNVGNIKEAFIPERSQRIRPAPGRRWRTLSADDHDLKCSAAAMAGADAWIDPNLRGVIFLGSGLGQELIDADLANEKAGFGKLLKCDVIKA